MKSMHLLDFLLLLTVTHCNSVNFIPFLHPGVVAVVCLMVVAVHLEGSEQLVRQVSQVKKRRLRLPLKICQLLDSWG